MSRQFIDQRWYDELCQIVPIHNVSSIFQSTITHESEQAFLDHGTIPSFLYKSRKYDQKQLTEKGSRLTELKQRIIDEEQDQLLRTAYSDKIDELLTANQLVLAALDCNWGKYREANQYLWGPYDKTLQAGAGWTLGELVRRRLTEEPDSAFDALLEYFTKWEQPINPLVTRLPNNDTFLQARAAIQRWPIMQCDTSLGKTISIGEIITRVQTILAEYAPDYIVVCHDSPVVHFKVSHQRRQLIIYGRPEARIHHTRYTGLLLGHEIGVHIMRRHNATQGALGLFVSGGSGSSTSEEGLGVIVEQAQWKTIDRAIASRRFANLLSRYHAVGMVLDGYSFQEVYDFYKLLFRLFHKTKPEMQAHHYAWKMVGSVYRGTPADTSGTVFMRPSIYLKQTLAIWESLATNSELLNISIGGKFNILNAEQVELISKKLD